MEFSHYAPAPPHLQYVYYVVQEATMANSCIGKSWSPSTRLSLRLSEPNKRVSGLEENCQTHQQCHGRGTINVVPMYNTNEWVYDLVI
jgi:hypothetical protein